ncbi:MAG: hypothetical protein ACK4GT_03335 [Pararhodobacter sp.]
MNHVLPAARGLHTLYALSSEKLWFALAVAGGLILAGELVEAFLLLDAPRLDRFGY